MILSSVFAIAYDSGGQIITDYLGRVFVRPDGRNLLQSEYPELYQLLSSRYDTASTPAGSFRIPDFTDAFLRGTSFNTTTDPDKASRTIPGTSTTDEGAGTIQTKALTAHAHASPGHAFVTFLPAAGGPPAFVPPDSPDVSFSNTSGPSLLSTATASGQGTIETGADLRPMTVIVDYLMRIK